MIILKKPQNGEKITLLTDEQLNFISTDRSQIHTGKSSGFDYLNLKIERKIDCSFPKSIRFEWKADEKGIIQISENEEFDFFIPVMERIFMILKTLNAAQGIFGECYVKMRFRIHFILIQRMNIHVL